MCDMRISNIEDICSFNPEFKKGKLFQMGNEKYLLTLLKNCGNIILKIKNIF